MALDQYGVLYTWGGGGQSYNKGQCGHGNFEETELPSIVKALQHKPIKRVAAGGFHTVAVTEEDELYAWGSGTYGELGTGDQRTESSPKLVAMPQEVLLMPSDDDPTYEVLK